MPLAGVLGVSLIKEGVEDWKRHKQDKEINNRAVEVLDPASGKLEARRWADVRVGNIVRVAKDDFFPADLLLLSTDNESGTRLLLLWLEELLLRCRRLPPQLRSAAPAGRGCPLCRMQCNAIQQPGSAA